MLHIVVAVVAIMIVAVIIAVAVLVHGVSRRDAWLRERGLLFGNQQHPLN